MARRDSRSRLTVAIAGTGSLWEEKFLPVLKQLAHRVRIVAVYDDVKARAESAALLCHAEVAPSLSSLVARADIDGIIVCDAGFGHVEAVRILAASSKTILLADWLRFSLDELRAIFAAADDAGTSLLPGLTFRYRPASLRALELIATRLGTPRQIERIPKASEGAATEGQGPYAAWCQLLDFVSVLTGRLPIAVSKTPVGERFTTEIRYRGSQSEGVGPAFLCRGDHEAVALRIQTAKGELTILSSRRIVWREQGRVACEEELTEERDELLMLVDQFCRRLAGGLLPVPDLWNLIRSANLYAAAEESANSGRGIDVLPDGRPKA